MHIDSTFCSIVLLSLPLELNVSRDLSSELPLLIKDKAARLREREVCVVTAKTQLRRQR